MQEVVYRVHVEASEKGGFIAYFPSLPGCHTQGETFEEVLFMAKDVLVGYLQALRARKEPMPQEILLSNQMGFDFPLRVSLII